MERSPRLVYCMMAVVMTLVFQAMAPPHSLQQARRAADDALFLDRGRLVEKGQARQVLFRPDRPATNGPGAALPMTTSPARGRMAGMAAEQPKVSAPRRA